MSSNYYLCDCVPQSFIHKSGMPRTVAACIITGFANAIKKRVLNLSLSALVLVSDAALVPAAD
jgi:hypothetical protein